MLKQLIIGGSIMMGRSSAKEASLPANSKSAADNCVKMADVTYCPERTEPAYVPNTNGEAAGAVVGGVIAGALFVGLLEGFGGFNQPATIEKASPDQVPLVGNGYPTDIAPCKTFHRAYDMSHFCSIEAISTSRLCRNYRVSHNFTLSPNQFCSLDTAFWGSFAYTSSCPNDQISAIATWGVYVDS